MSLPLPIPTRGKKGCDHDQPAMILRASSQFLDPDERFEVQRVKIAERPHLLLLPQRDRDDDGGGDAADTDGVRAKHSTSKVLNDGGGTAASIDPNSNCRPGGGQKLVAPLCGVADDDAVGDESTHPLPLIDGTDVPGWRAEGMVELRPSFMEQVQSVLNVGASSTFFRRDSQWPVLPPTSCDDRLPSLSGGEGEWERERERSVWDVLRDRLSVPPPPERDAECIEYRDACEVVTVAVPETDDDSDGDSLIRRRTATRFAIDFEGRNVPAKILNAVEGWRAIPRDVACENDGACCRDGRVDRGAGAGDCCGETGCEGDDDGVGGGWTFNNLRARFGHVMWRFSDTHGEMLSLETYGKYINGVEGRLDDSPLAVYDSEFGDDDSPSTNVLLGEYSVPECFSDDLFALVEESEDDGDEEGRAASPRPPYRWILIGPERSGTGMHVDPLLTNAWVTVLEGRKRWVLFPPATPPEEVGMIDERPQIPSSLWFRDYYDKVKDDGGSWPEVWRPVEVLQGPGETVFVPAGWMHAVLNLELTVAVTHNYASEHGPFEEMWRQVVTDEPAFAGRWYRSLVDGRPDLADRVRRFHRFCRCEGRTKLVDLN